MAWKNSQFMIYRGTVEELQRFINRPHTQARQDIREIAVYSRADIEGILHWSTADVRSDEIASIMGFTKIDSFIVEPA